MDILAFHDRERELGILREVLAAPRGQLFIVYGRRGVGKSALLSRAVAGVPHIYYRATRRTLPLQLESLTAAAREAYPDEFVPQTFASTDEFLQFLAAYAARKPENPVIAVIDELPYLADVDPGILTVIQHWWDRHKALPNLRLFLSGSYVSFMEREVLDARAPLYNRRTGAMHLRPLDYFDAATFFPLYTPRERIEVYAVLGGMPSYLEQFDPALSLDANLLATALRPNTYLGEEPEWLLLQDLRSDIVYGSILRAIARGERKPGDIARAIGKQSAQDIARQLESLRDLGLVRREVPVTEELEPRSRRSLYWLADNYLAFWYRYVDPARSLIAQGRSERVLQQVKETFHEYVSAPPWEEACRQFLWRAHSNERLPAGLEFSTLGRWWNGSHEIDVVGLEGRKTVLAGSCKWTNAPMGVRDLAELQQALEAGKGELRPVEQLWYALFSREGFEPALVDIAAQVGSRVLLYTVENLFESY